jgi:hypothetical protein
MRHTGKWWWTVKLTLAFAAIGILWLIGESVVSWAVLAFLLVAYGWVVWHNWNEAK